MHIGVSESFLVSKRKHSISNNGFFNFEQITPPELGQYFLKIYAKPEAEIYSEHDTLDHVATFLIQAHQVS